MKGRYSDLLHSDRKTQVAALTVRLNLCLLDFNGDSNSLNYRKKSKLCQIISELNNHLSLSRSDCFYPMSLV